MGRVKTHLAGWPDEILSAIRTTFSSRRFGGELMMSGHPRSLFCADRLIRRTFAFVTFEILGGLSTVNLRVTRAAEWDAKIQRVIDVMRNQSFLRAVLGQGLLATPTTPTDSARIHPRRVRFEIRVVYFTERLGLLRVPIVAFGSFYPVVFVSRRPRDRQVRITEERRKDFQTPLYRTRFSSLCSYSTYTKTRYVPSLSLFISIYVREWRAQFRYRFERRGV